MEDKSRPAMCFGMPAPLKPTAESILDNWVQEQSQILRIPAVSWWI